MSTAPLSIGRTRPNLRDIGAPVVWGVWLLYTLGLFAQVALFGVNLPKFDEWWDIIPVFDGQRPLNLTYLWTPNFGHRLVLSRLTQIGLLQATHGDFRAGMYFNALCLVLAALVLLVALRHARPERRNTLSDVTIPLILLSWTHFDNVLWAYQAQYVLSVLFVCCLLGIVLVRGNRIDPPAGITAGVVLLLLPICGFNGWVFAPLTSLWLVYTGLRRGKAGLTSVCVGGAAFLWCLICLANPRQGSVSQFNSAAAVRTFLSFLSIGFGVAGMPAADGASRLSRLSNIVPLLVVVGVLIFLACRRSNIRPGALITAGIGFILFALSAATWAQRPLNGLATLILPVTTLALYGVATAVLARFWGTEEQGRATGLFILLVSSLLLSLAIGLGRGTGQMSPRYATLAAVPLVVLYTILSTYRSSAVPQRRPSGAGTALAVLIALTIALAPINFNRIRANLPASTARQRELLQAIRSGIPITRLAATPYDFRSPGPAVVLADLPRLKAAGIAPYTSLSDDSAPRDLAVLNAATAVCDGVKRRNGDMFTTTRSSGGTVTFLLSHPYASPIVRFHYAYVGIERGDPCAVLILRPAGTGTMTLAKTELSYNDWVPSLDADALCTTDATVNSLVITLPAGTTLRLKQASIWR